MSTQSGKIPADLEAKIGLVAVQLRRREIVRAALRFGLGTLGLTVIFTLALSRWKYAGLPGISGLLLFLVAEILMAAWFLVRPLRAPLSLRKVALFIDERHPEIENRIITAIEFGEAENPSAAAWMIEKCLEQSNILVRQMSFSDLVDPGLVLRLGSTAFLFLALSGAVMIFRHDVWIHYPTTSKSDVPGNPARGLEFSVEPGDVRVRKGENATIVVKSLSGGKEALIEWAAGGGNKRTDRMAVGTTDTIHHFQFTNIEQDIEYRVNYGGRESKPYKITAWIPPQVESIDLTYRYPDYLNLPPREVPNAGAITAVEGSNVNLEVRTNKPVKKAEIVLASGSSLPMQRSEGTLWTGGLDLLRNDKYHIELTDTDGAQSEYNPTYDITAQPDNPPKIKLEFPRGDSDVTSLDEVPFTFEVSDDFGLQDFGLQYEVVGKDSARVPLGPGKPGLLEARGSHTMFLEDLGLHPGDLVSWTVYAKDGKPGRDANDELADLYFLEIRPFRKHFEEAMTDQSQMPGMEAMQEAAADQKEIIIATWNLKRRARTLDPKEFESQRGTIIEAEKKIQSKYEAVHPDDAALEKNIQQLLEAAVSAIHLLDSTTQESPDAPLSQAIEEMQRIYRLILQQRPGKFQIQRMLASAGGMTPKNPPEVDELEPDKNRNFYEEEKRTQKQQEAADQALAKIKELAQRQSMINDEISRLISEIQKTQDEEEKRKLNRQLEKLREEERKNIEKLDELQRDISGGNMDNQRARDASSGLEDARDQMNRSLKNLQEGRLQQARISGSRALEGLNQVGQSLSNLSREAAAEKMKDLRNRLSEISKGEDKIKNQVGNFRGDDPSPSLRPQGVKQEEIDDLMRRKSELAGQFRQMMEHAADLAQKSEQTQELMSRKLGDWLRKTSADGILEDMQTGEPLIRHGLWDSAADEEKKVSDKLAKASDALRDAEDAVVGDDLDAMQKALARLRDAMNPDASNKNSNSTEKAVADSNSPDEGRTAGTSASSSDSGTTPRATSSSGESPRMMLRRGEELMRQGKVDEAAKKFTDALKADPSNADAHNALGLALAQKEKFKEARSEFEKALAQDPDHSAARNNLEKVKSLADLSPSGEGNAQPKKETASASKSEEFHDSDSGTQSAEGQSGQRGNQSDDQNRTGRSAEPSPAASNRDSEGQPSPSSEQGPSDGTPSPAGGGRFGGNNAVVNDPNYLRRFIQNDYQRWIDRLRDAEALLPKDAAARLDVERIRGRIEDMRRDFRRHSLAPQFDLFSKEILNPLAETADRLERDILKALRSEEFVLTDEGSVPSQYRKRVADYFESLSGAQRSP